MEKRGHSLKNLSPSQKALRPSGVPSWLRARVALNLFVLAHTIALLTNFRLFKNMNFAYC